MEQGGLRVARSLVGTYVTSLDMAGLSITVSLLDEQRLLLWDAQVSTVALRWGAWSAGHFPRIVQGRRSISGRRPLVFIWAMAPFQARLIT